MKHNKLAFFSGMLTASLALLLVTGALAAGGTVKLNKVNIDVMGQHKFDAGEEFVASDGEKVPSSLTYVDEAGQPTTYLPMAKMAEFLDADILWCENTQTVNFGGGHPGEVVFHTSGDEPEVRTEYSKTPVYGKKNGPFTEVKPFGVKNKKGRSMVLLDHADFKCVNGFCNQNIDLFPPYGDYVEVEVTNHGNPVTVDIWRPVTISEVGTRENFTKTLVGTGETATRAFCMDDEDNEFRRMLRWTIQDYSEEGQIRPDDTDITVTITQYNNEL